MIDRPWCWMFIFEVMLVFPTRQVPSCLWQQGIREVKEDNYFKYLTIFFITPFGKVIHMEQSGLLWILPLLPQLPWFWWKSKKQWRGLKAMCWRETKWVVSSMSEFWRQLCIWGTSPWNMKPLSGGSLELPVCGLKSPLYWKFMLMERTK